MGTKESVSENDIVMDVLKLLEDIQDNLFKRALEFRENNTHTIDSWDEFKNVIENEGGFISAHWCGSAECEAKIKEETKATIRCIPFDQKKENGECVHCNKPSEGRVIFAIAY